ncbi:uncharacterized protein [Littorina saxatilis]|uniref:uncharacterized protein n=1 Tax=Littorina saxatilis TaxID=31220 RepID=UPI0038B50EC5
MNFTMTMKAKAAVMVVAMTMMMIGMTTANKSEVGSLRRRRRSLPPCTRGKTVPVKICVKTAVNWWGGTDSNVMVRLNGASCYSPYKELESPQNDFEIGDYDCYKFNTWDVGYQVNSVQVKLDPFADDWLMAFMTLRYNNAKSCTKYSLGDKNGWFEDSTPKTLPRPSVVKCSDYKLND